MTEEFLLEEFLEKEKELGLNDVQYMQMPLWRLFRVSYREKYIKKYLVLKNYFKNSSYLQISPYNFFKK